MKAFLKVLRIQHEIVTINDFKFGFMAEKGIIYVVIFLRKLQE